MPNSGHCHLRLCNSIVFTYTRLLPEKMATIHSREGKQPVAALTTVFFPSDPSWCRDERAYTDYDCMPPDYHPTDYYSPGICPYNWTVACHPTISTGFLAIEPSILPVETAGACCPP